MFCFRFSFSFSFSFFSLLFIYAFVCSFSISFSISFFLFFFLEFDPAGDFKFVIFEPYVGYADGPNGRSFHRWASTSMGQLRSYCCVISHFLSYLTGLSVAYMCGIACLILFLKYSARHVVCQFRFRLALASLNSLFRILILFLPFLFYVGPWVWRWGGRMYIKVCWSL